MLFFYLEPYTYMRVGKNGVLLSNLLDNKTHVFSDSLSKKLAKKLQVSQLKTIPLSEIERQSPLVQYSVKSFMGGLLEADTQPLQFYPDINLISGSDAYKRAIVYSKCDVAANLRKCTFFLSNCMDNHEYIALKSGIENLALYSKYPGSVKTQCDDLFENLELLYKINKDIQVLFCGANMALLVETISIRKLNHIHFVYSNKTLLKNKNIYDYLAKNNVSYSLMLDSEDNFDNADLTTPSSILYKIDTEKAMLNFIELSKKTKNIKPCLVMNSQNMDFIKSVAIFSEDSLNVMKDKMHLIMSNNLVNSNYWGNIYIFPNNYVFYSLEDSPINKVKIQNFYNDFKNKFLTGNFIWTRIRDYGDCIECIYRFLCPSPNLLEDKLRKCGSLKCLICKRNN